MTVIDRCLIDSFMVDPPALGATRVPARKLGRWSCYVVWRFEQPEIAFPLLSAHVRYVDRDRRYPPIDLSIIKTDRPLLLRRMWMHGRVASANVNLYCPRNGERFPLGTLAFDEDRTYQQSRNYPDWAVLGTCGSYTWQPTYCLLGELAELESGLIDLGPFSGNLNLLAAICGHSPAWLRRRLDALKRHSRRLTITYLTPTNIYIRRTEPACLALSDLSTSAGNAGAL